MPARSRLKMLIWLPKYHPTEIKKTEAVENEAN